MNKLTMSILPVAVGMSLTCAFADQATTPVGSGYANACAGDQYFSTLPNPGSGFSTTTDSFMTCQTNTGAPAFATASNSGTVNGTAYSNSATSNAGPGFIKVGASNSGATNVPFPGAAAYGGWNDQFTINGGVGSAVWVAELYVTGNLTETGPGGLARLGVAAYLNHNFLQPYGNSINGFAYNGVFLPLNGGSSGIRNSEIYFSWDYQGLWFGADSVLHNYSLARTMYFGIPFTYGTPFTAGFYLGGVVGEGASGASQGPDTSSFDFTHTATWGGQGFVVDPNDSSTTTNFTISSQSGFDYSVATVPEPATGWLFAFALCSLVVLSNLVQRRASHGNLRDRLEDRYVKHQPL
jgi:hypothetical protein